MRFLRAFLAWTIGGALGHLLALIVVNPRDEFPGHWFPPVFLDVRRDKIQIFQGFNRTVPMIGVILGSSRQAWDRLQHKPPGELLGQRGRGEASLPR